MKFETTIPLEELIRLKSEEKQKPCRTRLWLWIAVILTGASLLFLLLHFATAKEEKPERETKTGSGLTSHLSTPVKDEEGILDPVEEEAERFFSGEELSALARLRGMDRPVARQLQAVAVQSEKARSLAHSGDPIGAIAVWEETLTQVREEFPRTSPQWIRRVQRTLSALFTEVLAHLLNTEQIEEGGTFLARAKELLNESDYLSLEQMAAKYAEKLYLEGYALANLDTGMAMEKWQGVRRLLPRDHPLSGKAERRLTSLSVK
ncbi:MAG: hypothetical protein HY391_03185 [Deltaproteobacteria bacterium]|nr:hypothetical protein [Deltaproteobacteria bacterium]